MGYPAEQFEGLIIRNNIDEVVRYAVLCCASHSASASASSSRSVESLVLDSSNLSRTHPRAHPTRLARFSIECSSIVRAKQPVSCTCAQIPRAEAQRPLPHLQPVCSFSFSFSFDPSYSSLDAAYSCAHTPIHSTPLHSGSTPAVACFLCTNISAASGFEQSASASRRTVRVQHYCTLALKSIGDIRD